MTATDEKTRVVVKWNDGGNPDKPMSRNFPSMPLAEAFARKLRYGSILVEESYGYDATIFEDTGRKVYSWWYEATYELADPKGEVVRVD